MNSKVSTALLVAVLIGAAIASPPDAPDVNRPRRHLVLTTPGLLPVPSYPLRYPTYPLRYPAYPPRYPIVYPGYPLRYPANYHVHVPAVVASAPFPFYNRPLGFYG